MKTFADEIMERIEEAGRVKRYEVLKESYNLSVGVISDLSNDDGYWFVHKDGYTKKIKKEYVENNPEWFREVSGRWRPKANDWYFYYDSLGNICSCVFRDSPINDSSFNFGNCFPSREEAQEAAELVKKTLLAFHKMKAAQR